MVDDAPLHLVPPAPARRLGRIESLQRTHATISGHNLLEPDGASEPIAEAVAATGDDAAATDARPRAVVMSTGWFGGPPLWAPESFAAPIYPQDHRTWSGPGWRGFEARWRELAPRAAAAAVDVWWWPHHRHAVSDGQSIMTLARRWADEGPREFGVCLEPTALLTPAMLGDAEDHLARVLDALSDQPALRVVVFSSAARVTIDGDEHLVPCPPGLGVVEPELVMRLIEAHVPRTVPVVIRAA